MNVFWCARECGETPSSYVGGKGETREMKCSVITVLREAAQLMNNIWIMGSQ